MKNEILEPIRKARAKLVASLFVQQLFISLIVVISAVTVLYWIDQRYWNALPLKLVSGFLIAGALGWSLISSLLSAPSLRSTALVLDNASNLDERLSTTLYLCEHSNNFSKEIQAVLEEDAKRMLFKANPKLIKIQPPRGLKLMILPIVLFFCGFLLPTFEHKDKENNNPLFTEGKTPIPAPIKKKESTELKHRAFHLDKFVQDKKLNDIKDLGTDMKKLADEMIKKDMTKEEALAKISKLGDKIQEKKDDLTKHDKFTADLADKLKKYQNNTNSDTQKKLSELAKNLADLKELAAKEKLREEEIEKLKEEAKKLTEELKDMLKDSKADGDKPSPMEEKLDELKKDLESFGKELDPSELKELGEDFGKLDSELGKLLDNLELLKMLQGELDELEGMKEEFSKGEGTCELCGKKLGKDGCKSLGCKGLSSNSGTGQGDGSGFGKGPGRGPDGKANPDDPTFNTKPKAKLNPGEIIGSIQFKTVPSKGDLSSGYSKVYEEASQDAAEALNHEEIPRAYRLHVRDYFDSLKPEEK